MFRDEATLDVKAGKGGDGLVSFRREKSVPRGGPDGGDGGDGGDVILEASGSIRSLLRVARQPMMSAKDGQPGGPAKRTGRSGNDKMIVVPVGTQVFDADHGNLLCDLKGEGQRVVVARGGRGGKGNTRFKNSVRQVPRKATEGTAAERRRIKLELKIFAEVGLVGLPNAGKSTFLSRVTQARPRIADYPFTTLEPQVGIAMFDDYETLVLADLPGLIEGASEGVGLGHRFLKHVERCRVLLHLVDVASPEPHDPLEAYRVIERELVAFSPELAAKPRIVAATKVEDEDSRARAAAFGQAIGLPVLPISSVQGQGTTELLRSVRDLVDA